ncbi:MAG: hypothetical protein DRQ10_05645 [Candidatus Hydrothermota bacterium]|nr:MAG: hypothetical protein DRQ10_05645 [Candidatus Hydrothermae bacterium]
MKSGNKKKMDVKRPKCPRCGVDMHVHQYLPETKAVIDIVEGHPKYIRYRPVRFMCPKCFKTLVVHPDDIIPRIKISEKVLNWAFKEVERRSLVKVCEEIGIAPTTLIRYIERRGVKVKRRRHHYTRRRKIT